MRDRPPRIERGDRDQQDRRLERKLGVARQPLHRDQEREQSERPTPSGEHVVAREEDGRHERDLDQVMGMVDALTSEAIELPCGRERRGDGAAGETDAGAARPGEHEVHEHRDVQGVHHLHRHEGRPEHVRDHERRVEDRPLAGAVERQSAELVRIPQGEAAGEEGLRDVVVLAEIHAVEVVAADPLPEAAAPLREAHRQARHDERPEESLAPARHDRAFSRRSTGPGRGW